METFFFFYQSISVIKVLVMINKYKHISIFALSVDKQAHWLQILYPAVLNTRSLGT